MSGNNYHECTKDCLERLSYGRIKARLPSSITTSVSQDFQGRDSFSMIDCLNPVNRNTKRQERRLPKIPGLPTYLLTFHLKMESNQQSFFLGQTSLRSHINMKLAFSGEKQKVRFHIVISYFLEIFNHSVKILSSCLEV